MHSIEFRKFVYFVDSESIRYSSDFYSQVSFPPLPPAQPARIHNDG